MKKLIALILSLTFVLALAGCGKTTGSGDPVVGGGEPVAGGADMPSVENDGVIQTEQTQPANTEYNTIDSSLPNGNNDQLLSADESYNRADGPREIDSSMGVFVSVNRNDESKFTAEEWADILGKVEKGEILFFETLEEELGVVEEVHND